MKYPYISTTMNNLLFYAKDKATLIGDESNCFSNGFQITVDESKFENNTHEYLQNTYGEVQSPEHAEFIIELAKSAGFNCINNYSDHLSFAFYPSGNFSYHKPKAGELATENMKQITIPLPPKADKQELSEWVPEIGDEVVVYDIGFERERTMIYRGKNKNNARIVEFENGNVILLGFEGKIKKPKTPEEELRDDIVWLTIKHMENKLHSIEENAYYLYCDLMGKYNITK